jgi:hypothetical protein
MAQENVGINITVGGNTEQALGSLKTQLRQATAEVQALSEKFGATSEQAVAAAKRASELKDAIGDSKNLIDAFNPDTKFKAFSQTLSSVAGGFAAVQGALGLLGAEGEDVQKTLAKVQSALALSQGLEQLGDLGDAFKNVKTVAIDAFKGIKAAIGSSGIGLLVLALGAIVAYWDEIKAAVSGVSVEQKKLTEETNKNVKAQQEKLSAIDSQDNILKLQGKSEKEILGIKIKQTDEVIKATEQQLAQQKVVVKAQLEAEKRNKEILQGIVRFLFAPLSLILTTVDQVGKVLGKDFKLEEKFSGGIAGLVFDPVEAEKKGKETIAAIDKSLAELKNKRAGYQLSIKAIDNAAANEAAEAQSTRIENELAKEKKLTDDLLAEYDKRKKDAKNAKILTQKELAALDEEERLKQKEANNKKFNDQIEFLGKLTNYTLQGILKDQQLKEDARKAELEADIFLQNAKFEAASAGLNLLSSLAGQNEKIANAIFVIDKALAIAKIVVDTQREISAYGANPTWSLLPDGGALIKAKYILGAKIRAGAGIAAIAATTIAKFKGGGSAGGVGGGASAPSVSAGAPLQPPQPQTTTLSNQTINAIGNQAVRAYVVENDVTSNQQRIAAIQQRARFG